MTTPMKLKIEPREKDGYLIRLDETVIHHVKTYEVKSSALNNRAELTLTLMVEFPTSQENTS